MKILIPSYIYPTDPAWEQIISAGTDHQIEVIVNPNSGPGMSIDSECKQLCIRLRKAGISTLGYVSTRYGEKPMEDVKADILKYSAWYGVENIFLDEADGGVNKLIYYQALYAHIPGKVVLNPGTVPDPAYLDAGDVLIIFEGDYQSHKAVKFPGWVGKQPKSKFAQIVHSTDRKRLKETLAKIGKTSGWAYVTDDVLPNPYDCLPGFWGSKNYIAQ